MSEKPEALAERLAAGRLAMVEQLTDEVDTLRRENERLHTVALQAQNAAIDLAQRYKRLQGLLLDILNDAQTSHWHRDIDAALQEPPR
jgi:hypothetical protein